MEWGVAQLIYGYRVSKRQLEYLSKIKKPKKLKIELFTNYYDTKFLSGIFGIVVAEEHQPFLPPHNPKIIDTSSLEKTIEKLKPRLKEFVESHNVPLIQKEPKLYLQAKIYD